MMEHYGMVLMYFVAVFRLMVLAEETNRNGERWLSWFCAVCSAIGCMEAIPHITHIVRAIQ